MKIQDILENYDDVKDNISPETELTESLLDLDLNAVSKEDLPKLTGAIDKALDDGEKRTFLGHVIDKFYIPTQDNNAKCIMSHYTSILKEMLEEAQQKK